MDPEKEKAYKVARQRHDASFKLTEKPHPDCDESCMYHCTEAGQHPPSCLYKPVGPSGFYE